MQEEECGAGAWGRKVTVHGMREGECEYRCIEMIRRVDSHYIYISVAAAAATTRAAQTGSHRT